MSKNFYNEIIDTSINAFDIWAESWIQDAQLKEKIKRAARNKKFEVSINTTKSNPYCVETHKRFIEKIEKEIGEGFAITLFSDKQGRNLKRLTISWKEGVGKYE